MRRWRVRCCACIVWAWWLIVAFRSVMMWWFWGLEGVAVVDDGADAVLAEGDVFFVQFVVFGQNRGVFLA